MRKGLEALQDLRYDVSMSQDINYKIANEECDIIEKELKEKEKQDFILKHLRKDVAIEYEIEQLEEEYKRSKK